jgi:hypothetical protein
MIPNDTDHTIFILLLSDERRGRLAAPLAILHTGHRHDFFIAKEEFMRTPYSLQVPRTLHPPVGPLLPRPLLLPLFTEVPRETV